MTDENCKAASKREESDAGINSSEREQARTHRVQMMMLDIDGILTRYEATTTDVLAAAQALATSAIGDLVNKSAVHTDNNVQCSMFNVQSTEALHRAADAIAEQIRAALHKRIDEGKRPDW